MVGFVLAGATLRLWNLRSQVMGGEELHGVRAAAGWPLSELLARSSLADVSFPIAAFHRLLLDLGATFSETGFRLPSILCGLLALIVIPRAFSGRVERFPVELLGWLLAFSPAFVLHSRAALPALPMTFLSFAAVLAFERRWNGGSRRAGVVYVLLGALAVWIHPGALPIVAAPFLFALGDLVRARSWRRIKDLAVLAMGLSLALAALLLPAAPSLLRRSGNLDIPLEALGNALRLQAGTRSWTLTVLFWAAALTGLALLLRRHPRIGLFTLTVTLGHVAGLLLLSPPGTADPAVLQRYLLPVLPFVLLWVAVAIGRPWIARSGLLGLGLQRSAARFFILFLFWTGPFLTPGFRDSTFMHHADFLGWHAPLAAVPDGAVPAIYRNLPRGPVLEYPWPTVREQNRSFYVYQRIHERRVLVSAAFGVPRNGIDLRNEVEPEPAAFLESPARTLVVHLRLPAEEDRLVLPGRPHPDPMPPRLRRYYRRMGETLAARLQTAWGPPDFADGQVRAWDLDRVRRTAGER